MPVFHSTAAQQCYMRCSVYRNETSFIVGDRDGFRMSIMPEEQETKSQWAVYKRKRSHNGRLL
eukprot:3001378-Amphidinium_carterae.3